jgi:hypothetical protein
MEMNAIISICAIVAVCSGGCREESTLVLPVHETIGGQFAMLSSDISGTTIDLGTVRNTSSFSFIISNAGNRPITGIALKNSNPMFEITSAPFDSLASGTAVQVSRIITITVIHGTNSSGIGLAPLLSMGSNYDTLLIDGSTEGVNGASTPIEVRKVVKVFALLADVRLFDGTEEVDLTKPTGGETGSGITTEEIFGYTLTQQRGVLLNSGNVPLDVTEYFGLTVVGQRLLQPNESDTLQHFSLVALDTKGTVTIGDKLHIASDGKCYFLLQ